MRLQSQQQPEDKFFALKTLKMENRNLVTEEDLLSPGKALEAIYLREWDALVMDFGSPQRSLIGKDDQRSNSNKKSPEVQSPVKSERWNCDREIQNIIKDCVKESDGDSGVGNGNGDFDKDTVKASEKMNVS